MTPLGIAVAVLFLVIALAWFLVWRHYRSPQTSELKEVQSGVRAVQQYAINHIGENSMPVGPPNPVAPGGRFKVGDIVSFAYSVNEEKGMFVHLFSGKLLRWRPQRWLIECMLLSMLEFEKQLGAAGIILEKGMKQLVPAPTGTIFVQYVFTPEQHRKFAAALLSLGVPQSGASGDTGTSSEGAQTVSVRRS